MQIEKRGEKDYGNGEMRNTSVDFVLVSSYSKDGDLACASRELDLDRAFRLEENS